MKKSMLALALLLVAAGTSWAGEDDRNKVTARVEPRNEVPAVSSPASGRFTATIDDAAQTIDYEFTFQGLQANIKRLTEQQDQMQTRLTAIEAVGPSQGVRVHTTVSTSIIGPDGDKRPEAPRADAATYRTNSTRQPQHDPCRIMARNHSA